jgi:hypothetical protein
MLLHPTFFFPTPVEPKTRWADKVYYLPIVYSKVMVKLATTRTVIEGKDSAWERWKYALAYPLPNLVTVENFRRNVDNLLGDKRHLEPKCLDIIVIDEPESKSKVRPSVSYIGEQSDSSITELSNQEKLDRLFDIVRGAMKGLGATGRVKAENGKVVIDLFNALCGTDEKPHVFRDKPTAGTQCLECGRKLAHFNEGEAFCFDDGTDIIIHK